MAKSRQLNSRNNIARSATNRGLFGFFIKDVIIAICFSLVFGGIGGYYLKSSQAQDSGPLCLYYDRSLCITPNGPGKPTYLGGGGNFSATLDGSVWEFTYVGSGRCLIESGGYAVMSSGGCTGAAADKWTDTSNTN